MVSTNINMLIIGYTGSGKSTLINYLYGYNVLKADTGRPVTAKGDFTKVNIQSPIKPNITHTLYDSWGLESDKAEEWKRLIKEKLTATLSYNDMFFGVIYCLSYKNARIQDFEISMLEELLQRGYKIVIALTQADDSEYDFKKNTFRERLKKGLSNYSNYFETVDICAEAVQKLGQTKKGTTFGKEELFKQLEKDIHSNFSKVFMANIQMWHEQSLEKINDFDKKNKNKIENFYQFNPASTVGTQAEEEARRLEEDTDKLTNDIFDRYNSAIKEAEDFYSRISGSFSKEYKIPVWKKILINIVPIVGQIVQFFSRKKFAKKQLTESLDNVIVNIRSELDNALNNAKELGDKLWQGKI